MKTPGCPDFLNLAWYEPWQLWICQDNWWMEGGCGWDHYAQPLPPNFLQKEGVGL